MSAGADHQSLQSSIDLSCYDALVCHGDGDDFTSPCATSFGSLTELIDMRRADRSSTLSIPYSDDDASFYHPDSESSSLVLSNNSILCKSPATSELDFSGVHYVESETPGTKSLPSPLRHSQTPVTKSLASPTRQSSAQESRLMSLHELEQLRQCMLKSLMSGSSSSSSDQSSVGSARESLDSEEDEGTDASFVAQLLPSQRRFLQQSQSGNPHFIDVSGRASETPSDWSMLSSTHTLPGEYPGVMPFPSTAAPSQSSPSKPEAMQMPRESAAVLIDAVRASSLQENDKCRFVFDLFDVDKEGVLSRDRVAAFVEATLLANNLNCYGDFQVHEMVDRLFKNNTDQKQHLSYSEFRKVFSQTVCGATDDVASSVASSTSHHTEVKSKSTSENVPIRPPSEYSPSLHYRPGNVPKRQLSWWQRVVVKQYLKYDAEIHWLVFYTVIMLAAFILKASSVVVDSAAGYAPRVAKGFAQVIMVDACFLLLPMCRNFVTILRQFGSITSRVPIDKHIEFHKICGVVMLVASLCHAIAWFVLLYRVRTVPEELWQQSQFTRLGFVRDESLWELFRRVPMWTGCAMLLIAVVATPMTHATIRRGSFNTFWLTHLLFVPFLVLILVHGLAKWIQPPQAIWWVLPPLALYTIEKRYRMANIFGGHTSITRVHFSQDTVAIFMKKPTNFQFHPGMYLYLNVPVLSRFEWHPFTISSAPEDDCLSVHIRNAGDWTGALHKMLKTIKAERHNCPGLDLEADVSEHVSPYPTVFIDGPVGAPSQDYYRYKSVVFVGAGIGVTPFASILRSIVHQWESFRCPCCGTVTFPRKFQIQKIYFYWITRDQESLTWFTETMNQLAALDTEGRLEIHNYFSPLKRESVVAPLRALQTFIHDVEGQDIISGLATKQVTHFGRPDWKSELDRIANDQQERIIDQRRQDREQRRLNSVSSDRQGEVPRQFEQVGFDTASSKKEDVAVFFCGPKTMGRSIHDECVGFNQQQRGNDVTFDFRSESF